MEMEMITAFELNGYISNWFNKKEGKKVHMHVHWAILAWLLAEPAITMRITTDYNILFMFHSNSRNHPITAYAIPALRNVAQV